MRLQPWIGVLAVAASLCACAVYRPAPLDPDPEILRGPALERPGAAGSLGIDLSQPLTPQALGLIAVAANPDLKSARTQAGVAEAQVFAAGLAPDPTLTLGADHILSGPDSTEPWLAAIAVDLASVRARGALAAGARATREQGRLDLAWREWQTAGQARLLDFRITALERTLALDQAARGRAESMLERVLAAAARGDVKADEVETRRLAAADAADKARQVERDLNAARQELNALLGLAPAIRLRLAPPPPPGPPGDADALFARARARRLDLAALRAGYASQEAVVRKAVLDQFPNLQLTVTRQRDTTNNQLIGPSVSLTLPAWNRNRGGIAVAKATRAQLRAEYDARLFTTRSQIADLAANLETARRQREEIAAQVTPLGPIVEATEAAAGRGDVARAVAESARQSLTDKTVALIALDQSIAEQTVALDLAVGAPMAEDVDGAGR